MDRIPIKVGPHILHVRKLVSGCSTSIILVHGLGVSGDYYVKYAEQLAPFCDVYVLDLPGYGKTPKPAHPLTIQQLAEVVTNYISQEHIHNVVVVGQSMGCQIVAHAISNAPKLFQKAILLAPTVNNNERSLFLQSFRLLEDVFHEPVSARLLVLKNYVRMGLRRFIVTSKFMIDDHIEEVIMRSTLPILMVGGAKDKIAPVIWVKFLTDITPRATCSIIQNAPHLLQYDKPEVLMNMTREFIDS